MSLTGTVERVATNGALAGPDLKAAVQARIEDDDGEVTAMTCPDTPRVAQGVVTVCHGSIDRSEWAIVVLFEDDKGAYTLLPI